MEKILCITACLAILLPLLARLAEPNAVCTVETVLATGPDPVAELALLASEHHVARIVLPPSINRLDPAAVTRVADLADFALQEKTDYKTLKLLNPWLRDTKLSNREGRTYVLLLPAEGFHDAATE